MGNRRSRIQKKTIKPKKAPSKTATTDNAKQPVVEAPDILNKQQQDWSEQDIIHLQRTLGNQATQRLIKPKNNAGKGIIQRAETGMRKSGNLGRYSSAALKLMTDNPNMAPNDFVREVHKLAGQELTATGAPPTILAFGGDGAGSFSEGTWTLEVNSADVFGTAATVGTANQAKVDDLVNTMYHETRHAEQAFRIVRMRAGKIIPQGTDDATEQATAAAQLVTDTGVPANIALLAAERPLYASWASKFGGKTDKMMEEAEAWDKNFFGDNKNYDWMMQSGFDDVTEPAMKAAKKLSKSKSDVLNYSTFSTSEKATILATVQTRKLAFINAMTDIDDFMTTEARPELARINGIAAPTATDNLMKGYLTEILRLYTIIETKYAEFNANLNVNWNTVFTRVREISENTDLIDDEVIKGYKNLPEEKDAFAAGDTAEAEMVKERAGTP